MADTQASGSARGAVPFALSRLHAGFPSPADEYREPALSLDSFVVQHPEATFYVRVAGDSMRDAGISANDILVVDRALPATHNAIIVAMIEGEFTVKRLYRKEGIIALLPANPRYRPIHITEEMDFQVWGVATYCLHKLR
jgi:DNA polymerase V